MHHRLRIAFSKRVELIQADIDACDATVRHVVSCPNCPEEGDLCPEGEELYQRYLVAQARAKFLMEDTPYVI
jgi:hypothetical protein